MKPPIALVSMPTASGRYPCFQLALLKPTLERAGVCVEPFSFYMDFGALVGWRLHELLAEVSGGLLGEWIWAREAFGDFADEDGYLALQRELIEATCERAGCTLDELLHVRRELTGRFLESCLQATDWGRFSMVGFTVLFQQQLATLAFARRLKERYPRLPIVLGGGTFEDDIAHELMQSCPQLDLIHCGDADETLPELVRRLQEGESLRGLPGVLWRDGEELVYAGRAPNLEDMDLTPVPDYDEYFAARARTGYDAAHPGEEVMLPFEAARGCWWGERCQCTFCGLNRAGLKFRAKSVKGVLQALEELSSRYGVTELNAIDNIVAPHYVDELFGALAAARSDLKLHYEIRPTIDREQLARMRLGGLSSVQPGIESFSTNVLRLMKKGLPAVRNLELLKWCTYYGIECLYDLLVGFEGERAEDYQEQLELVLRIPHLRPPYQINFARPDRGSPMYLEPTAHGIRQLDPDECYRFLYPEGRFDAGRISYYFRPQREHALPEAAYAPLFEAVHAWQERWTEQPRPSLVYRKALESIVIVDARGPERRTQRLAGREARLYELCADATRLQALEDRLGGAASWINQLLDELLAADLMVFLDGRYLALALPENPYHGLGAKL